MRAVNTMPVHLSVIIPAYNEAGRIKKCLKSLSAFLESEDYSWEVVVCNDGSTDTTSQIVRQISEQNVRVRILDLVHQGKGAAVRQGMLHAVGELRILCDADFSMPVEQISSLLDGAASSDVVIASRELQDSRRFNEPSKRHFMGRVFNFITRLLVLPGINDSQCGFKLFKENCVSTLFEELNVDGFAFDVEVLVKARIKGFSILEVPIDWYYFEGSKVRLIRDTVYMFWDLLKISFKYRIIHIFNGH